MRSKIYVVLVVLSVTGAGVQGLTLESSQSQFLVGGPSDLDPVWAEALRTETFARVLMDADPSDQAKMLSAMGNVGPWEGEIEDMGLVVGLDRLLAHAGDPGGREEQEVFHEQLMLLAPDVKEALARLVSAMVVSLELREQAFSGLTDDEQERLFALLPYLEDASDRPGGRLAGPAVHEEPSGGELRPGGLFGDSIGMGSPQGSAWSKEAEGLLERVDPQPLHGAAAVLLQAADEALERLEQTVGDRPLPATPTSNGCDVLELVPVLCVRGAGDDVWTKDWWLAIDLGGDDDYSNNQGATRFPDIPSALLLDVAGNDTYRSPTLQTVDPLGPATQWLVAQGAGVMGVGVLMDGGGDDVYEAVARAGDEGLVSGLYTVAQGAGLAGAGALVSKGGMDRFTAGSENVAFRAVLTAQGSARYEAFGLLSRTGDLATHYNATAKSLHHRWSSPLGINATITRDAVGAASVFAQGAAAGATAALLDAGGDDLYRVHAEGVPVQLYGQGAGFFGPNVPGMGVLIDGGGNDTMDAEAFFMRNQHLEVVQTCADNQTCGRGHSVTILSSTPMRLFAQGAGDLGTGFLGDLGGGDLNTRTVRGLVRYNLTVDLQLEAEGSGRGNLTALALIEPLHTAVFAQGATVLGTGVLMTSGDSDDDYRIEAETHAHAKSVVTGSDNPFARAVSEGGDARAWGQGYASTGVGLLHEEDGSDRYNVSLERSVSAAAANFSLAQRGDVLWEGRGWAEGTAGSAIFAELGGDDEYGTVPGDRETGGNDRCWVNQPSGTSGHVGVGFDGEAPFASLVSDDCATGLSG